MANSFFVNDCCIWILDSMGGMECLKKIDMTMGELSCEYVFGESSLGKGLFSDMVLVDDSIVFVPSQAENIYIWSINDRKMQSFKLKNSYIKQFESSYTKFTNAVVTSDSVYLIPHKYSAMVKMDVKSLSVEYIDCYNQDVLSIHNGGGGFFEKGFEFENILYLLCNGSNAICMYDTKGGNYKILRMGEEDLRLSDLYFDGHEYWLADNKDRVLIGNVEKGEVKSIFDYVHANVKKIFDNLVWNKVIIPFRDDIWLFSYNYPIIKISTKDYKHENIQYKEEITNPIHGFNYVSAIKYHDQVYAMNYYNKTVDVFDLQSGDRTYSYSFCIDENKVLKAFIDMMTCL